MLLRVAHIESVADCTKRLRVVRPDGDLLPSFVPGAHVEVIIETPSGRLVRHYSLVSSPRDCAGYEIAVLHTEPSRGGSRFLHESVKVGDSLEVSAPRGSFHLAERAVRHTLIAGGIGITPIYAFAARLRENGEVYRLHYSARSRERMAFAGAIEADHGERATLYVDRDGAPTLDLSRALGAPAEGHHVYTWDRDR